jgi:hypothetical protein
MLARQGVRRNREEQVGLQPASPSDRRAARVGDYSAGIFFVACRCVPRHLFIYTS